MAPIANQTDSTRRYVFVRSVSPHRDGNFGRAGYRFSRTWRPLEVLADDATNADGKPRVEIDEHGRASAAADGEGIITDGLLARLEAEDFLAVKPATQAEIDQIAADRAAGLTGDPEQVIAQLRDKNADLEQRLMKLELAAGGGDTKKTGKGSATTPGASSTDAK